MNIAEVNLAFQTLLEEYDQLRLKFEMPSKLTSRQFFSLTKIDSIAGFGGESWAKHTSFIVSSYLRIKDKKFDQQKLLRLYHFLLDELDLQNCKPNTNKNTSKGTNESFVKNSYDFYYKANHYWKPITKRPSGAFGRPFRSFGLLEKQHPRRKYNLDDILSERLFKTHEKLKIGLFSLSNTWFVDFKITKALNLDRHEYGFQSNQLTKDELSINKELDNIISKIRIDNIDIACFPELVIDDNTLETLNRKIKEIEKSFFILVGGSYHRKDNEGLTRNLLPVIIYKKSKTCKRLEICENFEYYKLEKFNIKNSDKVSEFFSNYDEFKGSFLDNKEINFSEDISIDPSLLIFHSKHYGNFGFVICKDLLPFGSKLLNNYSLICDHLLAVSLNSGDAQFDKAAIKLVLERQIATFYVNSLAYGKRSKDKSFVIIPNNKSKVSEAEEGVNKNVKDKYIKYYSNNNYFCYSIKRIDSVS